MTNVGIAASFAAKLADKFGSEIGKRWGRHTVLITTLLNPKALIFGLVLSLVGGLLALDFRAGGLEVNGA